MVYSALISAHIYRTEDGSLDIEIFNRVDNDDKYTEIFSDVEHALMDQVEPELGCNDEYFFFAHVESRFVEYNTLDGTEYDVEHEVRVIKSLCDLPKAPESTE